MALDFFVYETAGQDAATRYEVGDLISIMPSRGPLTPAGPFRRLRVITSKTPAEVREYLTPKTSGQTRRRQYYLDTTKMSAADLSTWNTNRCIEVTEAVAISWISKK